MKWLLAIPHHVVLAFLWMAFVVLSVAAFFTMVFTGRYPRSIDRMTLPPMAAALSRFEQPHYGRRDRT